MHRAVTSTCTVAPFASTEPNGTGVQGQPASLMIRLHFSELDSYWNVDLAERQGNVSSKHREDIIP